MADSENKRDSSASVQIIVAIIGLAGVVATAVIANWNTLFPKPSTTSGSAPSGTVTAPPPTVTATTGRGTNGQPPPRPHPPEWFDRARGGVCHASLLELRPGFRRPV